MIKMDIFNMTVFGSPFIIRKNNRLRISFTANSTYVQNSNMDLHMYCAYVHSRVIYIHMN